MLRSSKLFQYCFLGVYFIFALYWVTSSNVISATSFSHSSLLQSGVPPTRDTSTNSSIERAFRGLHLFRKGEVTSPASTAAPCGLLSMGPQEPIQWRLPTGSQSPLGIPLLGCGVLHRRQVDLCSNTWSIFFLTNHGVCMVVPHIFSSLCSCFPCPSSFFFPFKSAALGSALARGRSIPETVL